MLKMKLAPLPALLMSSLLFLGAFASQSETPTQRVFRFHVPNEPISLDPLFTQSSDASYFLANVMRGLYTYSNEEGLTPEGAKSCHFKTPLKIECELAADRVWSDGSAIVAEDYVRAFRRLSGAGSRSSAVELLKNVKSAVAVHGGKAKPEDLGIHAVTSHRLAFEFAKPDPDFLFKLAASVLVPVKSETFPSRKKSAEAVVNGPYKVASWTVGRRVRLEPNLKYKGGAPNRPDVEILFIDDDETAYNLYEHGELTFLRRLPTTAIPKARLRPDFLQIPVARFDYIGFGSELLDQPLLREALAYSLDFAELDKILDALGRPGCPGLPRRFMDEEPCVIFNLPRAKIALTNFAKAAPELKSHRLKLAYSKLGGDDIKKQAEWLQAQWKKNLGLTIDIEASEQGVYLARLRERPPAIFRKGIGLESPTCLAALETFSKNGSENFVKFESQAYEHVIAQMTTMKSAASAQKKLCSAGVKILLSQNRLIPLGRIHFTILARPEFKGWRLNEMNQLDLSGLQLKP